MNPNDTEESVREVRIWMQLLGFERNDPDRGAKRYLDTIGYRPKSIVLLLYHPDFAQLHRGMDEEYELFPDNAAYYGIPRNTERERQPWTNYDLRELCRALKKEGVELYAGLMGAANQSRFHHEWVESHPEVYYVDERPHHVLNLLKRFRDGGYYEDFFIERVRETLVDYEFAGVQITDMFYTQTGTRARGDFSTDMTEQFLQMTGEEAPKVVVESLGDDTAEALAVRKNWLWSKPMRRKWLRFYAARWEQFTKKFADALHASQKKLMVLAQYCTDPVETYYSLGIDMKKIQQAGADEFCPNPLPTSVYMDSKIPKSRFHFMMTMIPLTAAYLPGAKLYPMLNVQDATEEWNVLKHEPVRFERDLLTEQAYRRITKDGAVGAADGYLICLGDGIAKDDWTNMRHLFSVSFSLKNYEVISPVLLWSDHAMDRYLDEYPYTLRPSVHKELYETAAHGALIGAVVRTEDLSFAKGPLFVSGFDLLSDEEQAAVNRYPYPVIATARPGFEPESAGFQPAFILGDPNSPYGEIVFGKGVSLPDNTAKLLESDGGEDVLPDDAVEPQSVVLSTISYRKVSDGFFDVIASLLNRSFSSVFSADGPMIVYEGAPGEYKLYLYNTDPEHYTRVTVRTERPVLRAVVESSFPRLPIKYLKDGSYEYDGAPSCEFRVKIAPDGISVVKVNLQQ